MAEFPALPLFTDAFIADTGHLDATETGAYIALLIAAWRSPDCSLPDDDARLARMARCDSRTWRRVRETVLAFWTKDENGQLRQKRLTKEREFCNTSRQKKQAAAYAAHDAIRKSKSLKVKETGSAERGAQHSAEQGAECVQPTPTPTPIITSPPIGGAVSADARAPQGFEVWEKALLAVEGVKGSKLEISAMHPVAALHREGFDLNVEVIPQLKADVAAAKQGGRLGKLSWTTLAKKIREARLEPASAGPGQAREVEQPWAERLNCARETRQWSVRAWGPMPGKIGCRVPAHLLLPGDGDGWTEWRAAS